MDSYSGIIIEESKRLEQFTDFTPIPCKGYNTLCTAKRYGRWWMLKGLKKNYQQDENYKNLLQKEFDILKQNCTSYFLPLLNLPNNIKRRKFVRKLICIWAIKK